MPFKKIMSNYIITKVTNSSEVIHIIEKTKQLQKKTKIMSRFFMVKGPKGKNRRQGEREILREGDGEGERMED